MKKGFDVNSSANDFHHATRRDRKNLQDFSEHYFSGEFKFYVEFTKELPEWLFGLLVEGVLARANIGRGRTTGYGRVTVKDIAFEKVFFSRNWT